MRASSRWEISEVPTQPTGFVRIHLEATVAPVNDDAVDCLRRLHAHAAVDHVLEDRLRRSFLRVAVAAGPGGQDRKDVALFDRVTDDLGRNLRRSGSISVDPELGGD